jgi:hypothetical protein
MENKKYLPMGTVVILNKGKKKNQTGFVDLI